MTESTEAARTERAAPGPQATVTHASGLTFKVINGDSHHARTARGVRRLTMADGTVWTVGTPIGWRGMDAAWQDTETPQEREARLAAYGASLARRDRIQLGLRIATGRRLVAAGFIRRATGRTLTIDATGTRVTARIHKTGASR
ncbi:hypothetical protein [Streptomyces sp. NPDC088812]|uniref:hypothetical protein n=1 Tax=Streptomyces sp. NPDC088812 TaxID=3365905 RepID=UPI00381C99F6